MSLTFFSRCEGATHDGTHDYSAGDTTSAAGTYGTTQVRVGTNSAGAPDGGDFGPRYSNGDPATIVIANEAKIGFWYYPTAFAQDNRIFNVRSAASYTQMVAIDFRGSSGSGNLRLRILEDDGNATTLDTSGANLATGNWYFVVAAWDAAGPRRRIAVYDTSMTLIAENTSTASFTAPSNLTDASGNYLVFGPFGQGGTGYVDNIFVADDFDEDIESYSEITSYTEYGAAAGLPKSLGLLLRGCG